MKSLAQVLGQYIEETGMKGTRLASSAGVSYNYLQRLLAGDRHPSELVVYKLAKALRLSAVQTGALLAAAGYLPPLDLLQPSPVDQRAEEQAPPSEERELSSLAQQIYSLAHEVPEPLREAFLLEMQRYLAYARYRYVLCGGASLLDLEDAAPRPRSGSENSPEGPS
jgi:transcriptional regulator with XRE-family HTH domain